MIFAMLLAGASMWGQNVGFCGNETLDVQQNGNSTLLQQRQAQEAQIQAFIQNPTTYTPVVIPVVVHYIYNTTMPTATEKSAILGRVQAQLNTLNLDFAGNNAELQDVNALPAVFQTIKGGNTGIQFCLASKDDAAHNFAPINNNGIIYVNFTQQIEVNDNTIYALNSASPQRSRNTHLNLYIVPFIVNASNPLGVIEGFATRPNTAIVVDNCIVINSDFVGSGHRTLTHEVAHWLDLYHIFQEGCAEIANATPCDATGDKVCDTPPSLSNKTTDFVQTPELAAWRICPICI